MKDFSSISTSRNESNKNSKQNQQGEFDLRPNFAILKHKSETLEQKLILSKQEPANIHQKTETPRWFFNIPDVRTPFPNLDCTGESSQFVGINRQQ